MTRRLEFVPLLMIQERILQPTTIIRIHIHGIRRRHHIDFCGADLLVHSISSLEWLVSHFRHSLSLSLFLSSSHEELMKSTCFSLNDLLLLRISSDVWSVWTFPSSSSSASTASNTACVDFNYPNDDDNNEFTRLFPVYFLGSGAVLSSSSSSSSSSLVILLPSELNGWTRITNGIT